MMDTARSEMSAFLPPVYSSAIARAPIVAHQKTRCRTGGRGLPFEVRQSVISDPESAEVTRYRIMDNSDTPANRLRNVRPLQCLDAYRSGACRLSACTMTVLQA
jgi:hypothetical protein